MNKKDLDLVKTSKLILQQIDNVTCIECCKYYIAPETAACGHTLCHSCWRGRSSCPACAKPLVRRNLRHNLPLQNLTEHVHTLCEAFEKCFKIKLLEYLLDSTDKVESENDPTKNVNDWLTNSENHFSVATLSSKQTSQETKKQPEKVIEILQDDWHNMEPLPDTQQIITNKENVVGPMDIEAYDLDYDECTVNNRRRSSRKKEGKLVDRDKMNESTSLENQASNVSSTNKKLKKLTQPSQETNQHCIPLNMSSSKIQIQNRLSDSEKLIRVSTPQDDWDKIETMPDTEEIITNKENVVCPMDIEAFDFDENNYTVKNPRRSSRKRELKPESENYKGKERKLLEKQSSKDNGETDKKSNKAKHVWNNVKRMRKEFSKLNKINRSKLNVSIEMCKKTQNTAIPKAPSPQVYEIDENTPGFYYPTRQMVKETPREQKDDNKPKGSSGHISNENIETPREQKDDNKPKGSSCHISNENIETNNCITRSEKLSKIQNVDCNQNNNKIESQETNTEIILPSNHKISGHDVADQGAKSPFYKKSALYPNNSDKSISKTINVDSNTTASDDIEITIKVGNTVTNVVIKRKNDIDLKVKADREIQTSFGPYDISVKNNTLSSRSIKPQNIVINVGDNDVIEVEHSSKTGDLKKPVTASVKTISEKKNTDSADTATVQFEITESVEKELSKVMDCAEVVEPVQSKKDPIFEQKSKSKESQKPASNPEEIECIDDLDIFDSESVKESDIKLLKNTEHAPSEILLCTTKTKNRTQKLNEKRNRDSNDADKLPYSKKAKLDHKDVSVNKTIEPNNSKNDEPESESTNYDVIMGTVFASIDADMEEIRQTQNNNNKNTYTMNENNKGTEHDILKETQMNKQSEKAVATSANPINQYNNQKDSENVFSANLDKEDENILTAPTTEKVPQNVPATNIEDFLTPMMCHNLDSAGEDTAVDNDADINDDSDKSVVEETPQKATSFSKKQKNNVAISDLTQSQKSESSEQKAPKTLKSRNSKLSIVNLVDTSAETSKEITVVETVDKKALETPLNINKFVDHITYKSTPMARKSLNFETENIDDPDPEQTMCPTNDTIAKTTQEKEFIKKVFEQSPAMATVKSTYNLGLRHKRVCIAGTCLTSVEIEMLKQLCSRLKWTYTEKYCKELTHLVVGVDEENKSQRSVKYMCALASSKWIVSFEWIEKCLQSKDVVSEEPYEALDTTGEPGPQRSRLATKKLFHGITFYCMEPFSVLDINTLKEMLEASGGKVVKEVKQVKVTEGSTAPAILLAEPEHTQEDRFIYLAMEQSIVPVNYEWALNCLGAYTLMSVQELLLCPTALLPKPTAHWPQELLARDD